MSDWDAASDQLDAHKHAAEEREDLGQVGPSRDTVIRDAITCAIGFIAQAQGYKGRSDPDHVREWFEKHPRRDCCPVLARLFAARALVKP